MISLKCIVENIVTKKHKIRLAVKRKTGTEEWVVRVWIDGEYNDDASYYTDDKQDARDTAWNMMQQYHTKGYEVDCRL